LLVEVDLALPQSKSIIAGLLSGLGIGLFMGIIGVRIALRFKTGRSRNTFCLIFMYLAYLIGTVLDTSAVSTTLMTSFLIAIYGYNIGLWPDPALIPTPLARKGIFPIMLAIWLLMGWFAKVEVTPTYAAGIGLSLLGAAAGILLTQQLDPIRRGRDQTIPKILIRKEIKIFLLLTGTLLLWPSEARIGWEAMLIGLASALLTIVILRIVIYPLFDLAGIRIKWPSFHEDEKQ
jgi:hypothetical protein